MMQQLCYLAITFSCTLCFAPLLRSLGCNETQYRSSHGEQSCCNKCRPGHYVVQHCTASSPTKCKPCEDQRYIQTYNMEWSCDFCGSCSASNMEYKSHCNATHDSVCKCKPGYECTDRPCTQCRPVSPTTRPPPPVTPVTVITVETSKDTLWLMQMAAFLLITVAVCVVLKKKAGQQWITSKCGYLLAKTHEPVSPCSDDEEVTKPVQEAGNFAKIEIDP
ncbi:tumor necrosis factor receptor superfamily member 5-like isoform X2 [Takifugu rubripes]|nr:tumor necrosis factor receptor superfamily member 5-like isoform X2 [Takifugu rubripes]XP_029694611.1 tumor necrosis factor receptor superfamily member 5 isoform X2 [Takifugu rubripes]